MIKKSSYFILLFCCYFVFSCNSFKKNASKSSTMLYETFFVNDSTLQYFIKPLKFKADKNDVEFDFTFRKIKTNFSDITVNFSVYSEEIFNFKKGYYLTNTLKTEIVDVKLLYKQKKKKQYFYRYTSTMTYTKMTNFLCADFLTITINDKTYQPTKRSQKILKKLEEDLFHFELSSNE